MIWRARKRANQKTTISPARRANQNNTQMSEKQEEKRGRGRPSNFPGVKTVTRLYKLPEETVEMIETLAANREQPLGVVLDAMIRRAFKDATRSKAKKPTAAAAS